MPSFYTHYKFGRDIIKELSPNIKSIVEIDPSLFIFANQGPDIFYFNIGLNLNNDRTGDIIHDTSFNELSEIIRPVLIKNSARSLHFNYYLGLSLHFLLDSTLHPTVEAMVKDNYSHIDIESELDRYYLIKDSKDPRDFKQSSLVIDDSYSNILYDIYQNYNVDEKTIRRGLKDFKLLKNIFRTPNSFKEKTVIGLLKLIGKDAIAGQVIREKPFSYASISNAKLIPLIDECIYRAPNYLEEVYRHIYCGGDPPIEFRKDFNGIL